MSVYKAITNYSGENDDSISKTADDAIAGLSSNADFTFIHELTDLVSAAGIYSTKHSEVATGGKTAVTAKDTAKGILEAKLATIATAVNLQAKGDLQKLQSTGLPLAMVPGKHAMEKPTNFSSERANIAGNMVVKVDKPIYNDHGTIFAFWKPELGPTPANINDWFFRHSNGHSFTITGLKPNVPYPFAAAYKGNDNEALVWSDIITKSPGD